MSAPRVTEAMLDRAVERVNATLGCEEDGTHFFVAGAYGGYRLEEVTAFGGHRDAMGTGYVSRRELFNAIHIFLEGVRAAKAIYEAQEVRK